MMPVGVYHSCYTCKMVYMPTEKHVKLHEPVSYKCQQCMWSSYMAALDTCIGSYTCAEQLWVDLLVC